METREMICIGCPLGCIMTVSVHEDEIEVKGNTCPRGETYAKKEVTNPTRIVTSSIKVENGQMTRVSVKTKEDIPKNKIMDCREEILQAKVCAPVHIGDILIENCGGTHVPVIATKSVLER